MIFLIFPVLAVVAGVLAWQQISRSNGTQTGREVAAIGLLLAVIFGGFAGFRSVYGTFRNHTDEEQIVAQVHKLGELLNTRDYTDAYSMFDNQFRKRVSHAEFENRWRNITASPIIGNVKSIDWNHLLGFEVDPVDNTQIATGMMLVSCLTPAPMRVHMSFRKEDGTWLIDQLQEFFPPDSAGPAPVQKKAAASPYLGPPKP